MEYSGVNPDSLGKVGKTFAVCDCHPHCSDWNLQSAINTLDEITLFHLT